MAGKLDLEARMAIKALAERGSGASSIARTLGVTEGAVRYHLRRQAAQAVDGRGGKPHKAAVLHETIVAWLGHLRDVLLRIAAVSDVRELTPYGWKGRWQKVVEDHRARILERVALQRQT